MSMSPEEIDEFLAGTRLAHFATVDASGAPRVRPVWYLWRDGAFWFTTRMKARFTGRDVAGGSPVTISIASEERPYRGVVAAGRAEDVGKDEELLTAISTRYGAPEGRRFTASAMSEPDRAVLKMVPDSFVSWDYGSSS